MPDSYSDICNLALPQLRERAYREQRETDPAFDRRIKANAKQSGLVDEILSRLSEDDRAALERDANEKEVITAEQMKYLYIQGAKDFILLMKKLGAM